MVTKKYFYLIKIQFIGFRFSGWQKQTNAKTVQEMVDRTISFITKHENFKTLGAGRTDAKVSANEYAFELFISEQLNAEGFLQKLNISFPPDIKALSVTEVNESFNIMGEAKSKEYLYIFTFGDKPHPFSAPFMVHFKEALDVELMKQGAKLFEGSHDFKQYCYKPNEDTQFIREVMRCEVLENNLYTASFFPKQSWIFKVKGRGFMRHQIRLMMGALVRLGLRELTLEDLLRSLQGDEVIDASVIAPSSGLMLNKIEF